MKAKILYRIAAVLFLLFACCTRSWISPDRSCVESDSLVASMHRFISMSRDLAGLTGTSIVGFGLFVSVFLLFAALLAWQLSRLPAETCCGCAALRGRSQSASPLSRR